MSPNKVLLSLTILLSLVYKSTAIYCFYCNSANNSACIDPSLLEPEMRQRIIPIIDCDKSVPRGADYEFFCRKIVQTIFHPNKDSDLRITRGCGWVRHERDCYNANNQDHLETACQCFTDYCNNADSLDASTVTTVFLAFAMCLYFYRLN